jgi:uncharacterized protein YkwD
VRSSFRVMPRVMRMPFRRWSLGALALVLSGCSLWPSASHRISSVSTHEAREAASLISAYRAAHGLSDVVVDPQLNRAAEHQARAVAQAGQLSHGNFAARMGQHGITGFSAENLTAGPTTVSQAVGRWKTSPLHNENLLLPEARTIGLARADSDGPYGRYWALVLSN